MKKLCFILIFGIVAVITYLNWDNEGDNDIDLSKIQYNVVRFNTGHRQIFDDSCEYYYVTKSDIRNAERILRNEFENYNKTAKVPRNHENYGRQYMGSKTSSGEILIYVNCLAGPDEYGLKWLFLVEVNDGGDGFFEARINLTTGEVLSFSPHGSA